VGFVAKAYMVQEHFLRLGEPIGSVAYFSFSYFFANFTIKDSKFNRASEGDREESIVGSLHLEWS